MADFTFGDILSRAVERRINDRSQQVLNTLENPIATLEDRANTAMGETTTATMQTGALPLPPGVEPSQAGAGRGFVNPKFLAKKEPIAPTQSAVPAVTGPAVAGDYNANIA
jgi:hypothetical protein